MGGGSDYPVRQGHVLEERVLSNTAVRVSKRIVLNHQFSSPLERAYW